MGDHGTSAPRSVTREGWRTGLLAATLLAASPAVAGDVTGVYVAGTGAGAEALHLKWADDEVVGRFVTGDRAYLLEGWLDEPGFMGTLYDPGAADAELFLFVAAPVVGGMKFSLYEMPGDGEMDLQRPLRAYELERAPGRAPEIPAELVASLTGGGMEDGAAGVDADRDGAAGTPGDGIPADMSSAPPARGPDMPASGGAAAAGAGPFHGSFHGGDGRGGQALLRFVQQGDLVQGEVTAFGAAARLAGRVNGSKVEGRLTAEDAAGTFSGTLAGSRLDITFVLHGVDGETTVPLQLERGEPQAGGELDPRLVGTWVRSNSYTSGDFSVATSQSCVIRADGTLTLYDSEMAGGGDAGSFSSGPSQGGVTSRWHTRGNQLYVNGQLYARFGFSGSTLGLWFSENGKPEIWSRR